MTHAHGGGGREHLPASVASFEESVAGDAPRFEWGATFKEDGTPLSGPIKGTAGRVQIPLDDKPHIVTHFHPPGSRTADGSAVPEHSRFSLSDTDVALALDRRIPVMRAFGANGEFMEIRTASHPYNSKRFQFNFDTEYGAKKRQMKALAKKAVSDPAAAKKLIELNKSWDGEYRSSMLKVLNKLGIEVITND